MKEPIKQYEKKITLQEACYYGFFILLSLAKGLGFYEGQKLFYLLVVPALVHKKAGGFAGFVSCPCGGYLL